MQYQKQEEWVFEEDEEGIDLYNDFLTGSSVPLETEKQECMTNVKLNTYNRSGMAEKNKMIVSLLPKFNGIKNQNN